MGKLFAGLNSKKVKYNESDELAVKDEKYEEKVKEICRCLEDFKKEVLEKFGEEEAKYYGDISNIFRDEFDKYINGHKKLIFNTRTEDVMKGIYKKIKSFDSKEVNEQNAAGYKKCFEIKFNQKDRNNKLKRSAVDSVKFSKEWTELWSNNAKFNKVLEGKCEDNAVPSMNSETEKIANAISKFGCNSDNYSDAIKNFESLKNYFKNNGKLCKMYGKFLNAIKEYKYKFICKEFNDLILAELGSKCNEKPDDNDTDTKIIGDIYVSLANYINDTLDKKAETIEGKINNYLSSSIDVEKGDKKFLKNNLLKQFPVHESTMGEIIKNIKSIYLKIAQGAFNTSIANKTFFQGFDSLEEISFDCQKKHCIDKVSKDFFTSVSNLKRIKIFNDTDKKVKIKVSESQKETVGENYCELWKAKQAYNSSVNIIAKS